MLCALLGAQAASAQGATQELQQKLATVEDSVAKNQAALHQYSWTEHTEISLKGEVKKTTDKLCKYGPDEKVARTEIGQAAYQAGTVSIGQAGPGKLQRQFKNYAKHGDALT